MTPITTEIKSEAHQSTGTVIASGGTMGKSVLCESAFPANQPHPSIAFKGLSQSLGQGMNTSAMLDCGGCFGKDGVFFLHLFSTKVAAEVRIDRDDRGRSDRGVSSRFGFRMRFVSFGRAHSLSGESS
ncbi:hypothetical protein TNCV_3546781 [Trichonephila clavipes]|nr:hypothetical protein TNCV_3546781 [Trichonephila clavipes]